MPLDIGTTHPSSPAVMAAFLVGCAIFLGQLVYARLHRGKADKGETRDWTSLAGFAVQCAAFVLCNGPLQMAGPILGDNDMPRLVAIILLMALCCLSFGWSTRAMGDNWAIAARTRADHQLVTHGPFALVRNPIYVGLFAFLVALALTTGHAAALLIAAPVYAVGTMMRVRREERLLRAHFGIAYDAYAARVKRFVPGLF